MDSGENIFLFISGLGIVQGVLLAGVVYFYPNADRSVNTLLALYLLSLSLLLVLPIAVQRIPWQNSFFHQPLPLLAGPLLYLYVRSFTERISWRKALPHFVTFVLFFAPAWWNMEMLADQYPQEKVLPPGVLRHPLSIILTCIKIIQPTCYFILSFGILRTYQRSIKHIFSDITHIHLNWAWVLVNGFSILIVIALACWGTALIHPEYFSLLFTTAFVVGVPYIYFITYRGIMQPTLWQMKRGVPRDKVEMQIHEAEELESQRSRSEKTSIMRPGIPDEKMAAIISKINSLLENDKIYCEPELTVQDLGAKLEIPSYQVSLAIKDGLRKNFYDLINGYRVDEAKRLLHDPKTANYKMIAIGSEAGFNSKTTFNTVFKKLTGSTPTEYRDLQKHGNHVSEPS